MDWWGGSGLNVQQRRTAVSGLTGFTNLRTGRNGELLNGSTDGDAAFTVAVAKASNGRGQEVRGSLTAARPLQFHLLHVNLTGRHPNGDGVDDGCVLQVRETGRKSREEGLRREVLSPPQS